ncbi:MAG: WYL domain-containing protein [Desulfovibrio sp.]|nr:WYL domain-containing protein [Desulfovibrio sp.]
MQQQRVCVLTYRRGLPNNCRTFSFAPMQVIVFRESISFLGWEVPESGPVKPVYDNPLNLYLQRCQNVILTRRSSSSLLPPPAAQHGPDASPFGTMKGEVFRVQVHFTPAASAYVYDRKWSSHQEISVGGDGSLTIEFDAQNAAEVVAWVLGFGSTARVLSPDWLKKRVQQELEAAAQSYRE